MNHLPYIRSQARMIKAVANSENKKPQLREAFRAKFELYDHTMKMLKDGADRRHVTSILTEMEHDLTMIQDPTWSQIGQRQAAYELIKILREE